MPSARTPNFHHRHNSNGSYDSICMRCFLTAATSQGEADLVPLEQRHICHTDLLAERGVYLDVSLPKNQRDDHEEAVAS